MASGPSRSRVLIRSDHPDGSYATRRVRDCARAFAHELAPGRELSVLVTTDAAIRELNRTWRAKRGPTDVLSFGATPGTDVLGDIVISLDAARRQAAERGKPLADELARLLAHGLLHLLGHDHLQADEAARMARAEVELLGTVGLVGDALAQSPAVLEVRRATRRRAVRSSRIPTGGRTRRTAPLAEAIR